MREVVCRTPFFIKTKQAFTNVCHHTMSITNESIASLTPSSLIAQFHHKRWIKLVTYLIPPIAYKLMPNYNSLTMPAHLLLTQHILALNNSPVKQVATVEGGFSSHFHRLQPLTVISRNLHSTLRQWRHQKPRQHSECLRGDGNNRFEAQMLCSQIFTTSSSASSHHSL